MKKRNAILTATLGILLYTNVASAAVLFSDDFDSRSDWSPAQGASGATCIPGQNCATPIPDGYYDYRVAGTEACSNTDGNHNTLNINGQHPRGGAGKSFMMWNEPCYSRSGSWGSDGLLGIDFAPQNEVYVRYWVQFQPDWRWNGDGSIDGLALGTANPSPMQKFMHISHLDPTNPNLWDFFSGTQNKPRFTPQLAKFGGGSYRLQFNLPHSPLTAARDSSASFTTNVYLGAAPLDMNVPGPAGLPAAPRDGGWHSFEFYVKLNSAGGVADGISKVWYDGALVESTTNVVWVPLGDDPAQWKWNHAWLGGNNANLYLPANEQWYAIDDVVVSTTYSGPPAQPLSLSAAAVAANTVSLSWSAGSNGVAYNVDGYRIYYGKDASNLDMKLDAGNVQQYDISSLDPSTKYYFAVSAYSKGSYDSNDNEGMRSVTASATTASGAAIAVADAVAPVDSISSPANGSTVSGNVTVNVAASDNVAVSKVELYLNGSIFGVVGSAPYTLSWNTANNPNATYTLTAKAYDAAGNVGQTTSSVVVKNAVAVLDASAPVIGSFTMPASATSLTVPVSAFAASDDIGVTGYQITENATAPAADATTWKTSAPTSFTFSAAGSRTAYAWCKDASGKVSAAKTALVSITIATADTAAPVVAFTSPVDGSKVKGTVTVSANITDNVAVSKVEYYVNGLLKLTSTSAPYSVPWGTTNYPDGSNTIMIKAYDAAGNVGQSSVTVIVANDAIAPSVSIVSPVAGSTIGGTVSVSANASDNLAVERVELYLNGALVATSTAAPYGFSWNTANAANGSYTVSAKAYDAAGNVGQASATVSVFNDTTAPSVAISSPVAGSTVNGTVSLYANASDNVGVTKVEFYLDGALQATSTAAPYGFSWNTANAANGSYTVSAKAYDAAGNVGQASATVSVFNDTTAPSVAISSPVAGSTVNGTVNLYANASDNVGVTKVEFYLDGALQATSTAAPYGFSWNTTTAASGTHTLSAKAYDASGNVGQSASVSVNVVNDSVAPVISVSAPTKDYLTSSKLPISASATDNVAVVKMEAYVDNALVISTNNSSFSVSTNIAKGVHTVTIKAYDASNNVAVFSKTVNRFF
ncbi:repeat-containing protein [Citrifermentans bemidjiense Bem]|uniref:Repeat-containing protein n=1 Tax=Citrifermentans bemidjiense (strain ATCC BAA-1014 / DSM 16622 / JCM 12645 / Bem) TaxID=404380 RepID=B5EAA9_CITBB|nr:Ig-like domain-containing protein [Citrifermentans bemidjiense]ACH38815.1 repeat-containing protein [Citrifermentans bemidjiense Bem]